MDILNNSHQAAQKMNRSFSLSYLSSLLCFDRLDDAEEFLTALNLPIIGDGGNSL